MPLGDTHELLIEPVTGKPRLVICGGGHVAQAISRQAQLLDFEVTILEDRPEFADPARFGGARVVAGYIPEALASLTFGWSSYIVVATRGHKLDGDCILAAVRTDAGTSGYSVAVVRPSSSRTCCAKTACRKSGSRRSHARLARSRRPDAGGDRVVGHGADNQRAIRAVRTGSRVTRVLGFSGAHATRVDS